MAVCLAVGSSPYPGYPVRQSEGHRVKEKRFHCCPQVHSTGSRPVVQSHLHEYSRLTAWFEIYSGTPRNGQPCGQRAGLHFKGRAPKCQQKPVKKGQPSSLKICTYLRSFSCTWDLKQQAEKQ